MLGYSSLSRNRCAQKEKFHFSLYNFLLVVEHCSLVLKPSIRPVASWDYLSEDYFPNLNAKIGIRRFLFACLFVEIFEVDIVTLS